MATTCSLSTATAPTTLATLTGVVDKLLTKDIAKDLPSAHAHPEQDLVFHYQDADTQEGADHTGVASPVIKERLQESDDSMNVLRPFVVR